MTAVGTSRLQYAGALEHTLCGWATETLGIGCRWAQGRTLHHARLAFWGGGLVLQGAFTPLPCPWHIVMSVVTSPSWHAMCSTHWGSVGNPRSWGHVLPSCSAKLAGGAACWGL